MAKPIVMILIVLMMTPSGVAGESLQHDADTESSETTYDLVRNIGAFSKVGRELGDYNLGELDGLGEASTHLSKIFLEFPCVT